MPTGGVIHPARGLNHWAPARALRLPNLYWRAPAPEDRATPFRKAGEERGRESQSSGKTAVSNVMSKGSGSRIDSPNFTAFGTR